MTDCALVKDELKVFLDMTDEETDNYDSLILYAVNWVNSLIKREETENDMLIVHLCAAKVYYQLSLMQNDGVHSFSAGEVSFSVDNDSLTSAEKLLEDAMSSCGDLIMNSSFAFKAV